MSDHPGSSFLYAHFPIEDIAPSLISLNRQSSASSKAQRFALHLLSSHKAKPSKAFHSGTHHGAETTTTPATTTPATTTAEALSLSAGLGSRKKSQQSEGKSTFLVEKEKDDRIQQNDGELSTTTPTQTSVTTKQNHNS